MAEQWKLKDRGRAQVFVIQADMQLIQLLLLLRGSC